MLSSVCVIYLIITRQSLSSDNVTKLRWISDLVIPDMGWLIGRSRRGLIWFFYLEVIICWLSRMLQLHHSEIEHTRLLLSWVWPVLVECNRLLMITELSVACPATSWTIVDLYLGFCQSKGDIFVVICHCRNTQLDWLNARRVPCWKKQRDWSNAGHVLCKFCLT